jgi:hypothetical protein
MSTRDTVLEIARADIGYEESPPGSNKTKFCDWYGVTGPWCGMYVSHAFYVAGLALPAQTDKGFSYCPAGVKWFQKEGRFDRDSPQRGDVVFFHFESGHEGANHVGIVEAFDGGSLTTLEGNTGGSDYDGGAVLRRQRPFNQVVLGFGHPKFSDASGASNVIVPPFPGRLMTLTSPYTKGNDVYQVQAQLNRLGVALSADGVYGSDTYAAVIDFQKGEDLKVDGVVGPVTWQRLWSAMP